MEGVPIDELALVRAERRRVAEGVDLAGQERACKPVRLQL